MKKGIVLLLTTLILLSGSLSSSGAAVLPTPAPTPLERPSKQVIRQAAEELKSISKKERKERFRKAKQAIKDFKKDRRKGHDSEVETLLLVLIAIILPPLAVYLHEGDTNTKFWITTILFVIGILGAFIFSWLLILAAIVYALLVILGEG